MPHNQKPDVPCQQAIGRMISEQRLSQLEVNAELDKLVGALLAYESIKIVLNVEPLVYTSEELQTMLDEGNTFLEKAFAEGRVLCESQSSRS